MAAGSPGQRRSRRRRPRRASGSSVHAAVRPSTGAVEQPRGDSAGTAGRGSVTRVTVVQRRRRPLRPPPTGPDHPAAGLPGAPVYPVDGGVNGPGRIPIVWSKKMSAIFFAAGPSACQRHLPKVRNIDVAPTILRLLDVPAADTVQGRAINLCGWGDDGKDGQKRDE